MNELTKQLVIKTAKQNKAAAKENGDRSYALLLAEHKSWLIGEYGWKLKQRSLELFKLWQPGLFDGEYIRDHYNFVFDINVELSHITMRVLWRKVGRDPELQLNKDWGDLPLLTVQP